jgi:hypothetical protein
MCEHFSTINDIVRTNSSNRDSMEEWQVQINNLWIEFNDNVREINTIYTSGI